MKKLILFELILIFLATTFESDSPPGWYQQTIPLGNKLITDIQFLDSLNGWVITDWGPAFDTAYVFKTSDGGSNWNFQYRFHGSFTAIQMADYNTGYIAGSTGSGKVWKTTNGGLNWSVFSNFCANPIRDINFVNQNTGWICSDDGICGGIFKTTNGGLNWQNQLGASFLLKKIFMLNNDTGWVISGDNKIYRTTNTGFNWLLQYNFNSEDLVDVFFPNKDTGWIHGGSTGLFKTTNSGITWDTVSTPLGYGAGKIHFTDSRHGWIGRSFGRILVTTNGSTWGYQNTPSGNHYAVYFIDSVKGWAGGDNLLHTTDGGGPMVSIQQVSTEIPTDYQLYQNYPNPFNPVTNIKYDLKSQGNIKLTVYDITGKEVSVLVNEAQSAGTYEADWNASEYSSGIYFYSLIIEGRVADTKKLALLK
jgi:photosystem II stability/assembly factor-like uncharacterized protein